jgi:SAM-dependent methyltransferase
MAPIPNFALTSAAAARNREPILAVLREVLPPRGLVLEIASGTGEHAAHFARHLPEIVLQPTDRDANALASIEAHRIAASLPNLRPPLHLDASAETWPVDRADAVVAINMVHISPWAATQGLFKGASSILGPEGAIVLYGPYREVGRATAPSNEVFDASLRARDPAWGLRDLGDVIALAGLHGFGLSRRVEMPANNLSLVFAKHP